MRLQQQNSGTSIDACSNSGSQFLSEIRPILVIRPVKLDRSATWVDSSSSTTCSARIPLANYVTGTVQVGEEQFQGGARVLELRRKEAIQFSGSGAQNQHQVTINGEGEGTTKLYIDLNSGVTTASDGIETVSVSITSSGQAHRFTQQIQQSITLVR